jgi:hypothetical protein
LLRSISLMVSLSSSSSLCIRGCSAEKVAISEFDIIYIGAALFG